ncbi:RNA-guided endonuclease InsQ/TnpB family protein [Microcoleus vaginatus]|uniref:RNA-guided endonuclease InsQ/TnpB family protein n=1 Tax=Microcoleus vaginatus TaxID=119532 RepID=UPI001F60C598|nr:transposase [Microcoleus vaginatus HSN003]
MLHKAIQVRLYPTKNQQIQVASTFGCARWWSNYGQNKSIEVYKKSGKRLRFSGINTLLPSLKKSEASVGLGQYYSQFRQATRLNLTTAYKDFFEEMAGFYKLPCQTKKLLFYYSKNVKFVCILILDYRRITQTKIKKYRLSEGKIQSSIISKKYSGKYLASILTAIKKAENQKTKEGRMAGDLGVKYFAIVPDEEKVSKYDNAKHFAKHKKNGKRQQQKLTDQQKRSNSEYKYRKAVAKVGERFRNSWQYFLYKLSYKLTCDRLAVIVENFYFWNPIRHQKLVKASSDEVLGSFTNFLASKLARKGGNLVEIDRGFSSSKVCSNCFPQMTEMPLDMREGTCPHCATDRDREGNAAIKIKAEGIKILKAEGSAVSALGCEVIPKLKRKSKLRHSPMSTEAPTIFGTTI